MGTACCPLLSIERPTLACVAARMVARVDEIAGRHDGQCVVVVSHGGAIKRFLGHVLDELPLPPTGQSTNAVIHRLRRGAEGWEALELYGCAHLENTADAPRD